MKNLLTFLLYVLAIGTISGQRSGNISWEMEKRFGIDMDGNGMIDLPNHPAYANPGTFKVIFNFSHTAPTLQELGSTDSVQEFLVANWYVNGVLKQRSRSSRFEAMLEDEVKYEVKAEFIYENRVEDKKITYIKTINARPNDILIVAMGDSYSSGEGNPDYPHEIFTTQNGRKKHITWADDGGYGTKIQHCAAHRSTTAWTARAAKELEDADPHTSVTYVNAAMGGATIRQLYAWSATKSEEEHDEGNTYDCAYTLLPQIQQVKNIVKNRKIEHLGMTIGGNDAGFAFTITAFKIKGDIPTAITKNDVFNSIRTGNWTGWEYRAMEIPLFPIDWHNLLGLYSLPEHYDILDAQIKQHLPNVQDIYIFDYPDLRGNCSEVFKYEIGELSENETRWIKDNLLIPLNNVVQAAALSNGWYYMKAGDFFKAQNAICKDKEGYEGTAYPGYYRHYTNHTPPTYDTRRYYRTARMSKKIQHDIWGVLHPNELGHGEYAKGFLNAISNPSPYKYICGKEEVVTARDLIVASNNGCESSAPNNTIGVWRSGEAIVLKPGFEAKAGANFSAYINPNFPNFNYNFLVSEEEDEPTNTVEKHSSGVSAINTSGLKVSPNPTRGRNITIDIELSQATETRLRIMSATGAIVYNQQHYLEAGLHSLQPLQIELSVGIYFVELHTEGIQHTQKLIVTR